MTKRGGKRPGAGRPKGSANRVTKEVRSALKRLVEENVDEMHAWFKKQWASDDGGKVAANLLSRLIEFAAPKLQRTDTAPGESLGGGGGADDMTDAELMAIVAQAREDPSRVYQEMMGGRISADLATRVLKKALEAPAIAITFGPGCPGESVGSTDSAPTATATEPRPVKPESLALPTPEPTPAIPLDIQVPEPVAATAPAHPAQPLEGEILEAPKPKRAVPGKFLSLGWHEIDGQRVLVERDPENPGRDDRFIPLSPGGHIIDGKIASVDDPRVLMRIPVALLRR